MVARICAGIPFQLLSAMMYYGPQSDIRVKTFARWNLPESSLLHSECLNRFPALCRDREERLWVLKHAPLLHDDELRLIQGVFMITKIMKKMPKRMSS